MRAEAAFAGTPDDGGLGRAVGLALGVHLLLALLLWLSPYLTWDREPLGAAGLPVMNADLDVSASEAAAALEALEHVPEPLPEPVPEEAIPPPQPLPEPIPEESLVERQVQAQERVPVPDEEQQDEARLDAISEEVLAREQEEKRRQEQVDLTEDIERQRQAEQRQRLARQREEQLQKIREEREKLQREMDMREQRLRQLAEARARSASEAAAQADAAASAPAGNRGSDTDIGPYIRAIQAAVTSKWTRPENMPNLPCRMRITQLPGGEVMSVEFDPSCPYDEAGRRSVEAAVLKAQPLPYAGFEDVFNRRLNFTFRPN